MLISSVIFVFILVLLSFWWRGHYGKWGDLYNSFPSSSNNAFLENGLNTVSFGGLGTGFNSVYLEISSEGISLVVEKWFRWAYPSISIKWKLVKSIEHKDNRTTLKLHGIKFPLELPGKYFDLCLKKRTECLLLGN